MQYIFGLLLVLASTHYGGEYLYFQDYVGVIAFGTAFILYAYESFLRRSPIKGVCALGFFYLICNASYVAFYRQNRYSANWGDVKALLAYLSLEQAFLVIFIILVLFILDDVKHFLKALGLWCLANSLYTLFGAITGTGLLDQGIGFSGFASYASVNGCLIAITIPFLPSFKKRLKALNLLPHALAVTAALLSKSSIPVGALMVVYATLFLGKHLTYQNMFKIISLTATASISFLAINSFLDKTLFDSGFRFDAWKVFMRYWYYTANMFFGFGPNTMRGLARSIQIETDFMIGHGIRTNTFIWLHMHNDWLQVLWEHGLVGLCFAVTIFTMCAIEFLRKKRAKELAALLTLGASCCFNFPIHYFPGAFILGVLVFAAIKLQEEPYREILDR